MIRFRIGLTNINGNNRYKNTHITHCPFCPEIENEYHVLFKCQLYKDFRTKYMANFVYPATAGDHDGAVARILSSTNQDDQRKIAMFIFYVLQLREEKIEELTLN